MTASAYKNYRGRLLPFKQLWNPRSLTKESTGLFATSILTEAQACFFFYFYFLLTIAGALGGRFSFLNKKEHIKRLQNKKLMLPVTWQPQQPSIRMWPFLYFYFCCPGNGSLANHAGLSTALRCELLQKAIFSLLKLDSVFSTPVQKVRLSRNTTSLQYAVFHRL